MLPRKSRRVRPVRRVRRRAELTTSADLEQRTLLAFSQLGFSLPNLAVSGQVGPRAAWGGVLDVSVLLQNIGASTTTEPLSQVPATQPATPGSPYGSTSTADAPDTVVAVLVTRSPKSLRGAVTIGSFEAPPVSQNSVEQIPAAFTLPARPPGFPGGGGKVFVWFVANATQSISQPANANNVSGPVPVRITGRPLPELRAIALGIPNSLHPGDTITPEIQIENFGTADPDLQGPVTVYLVASVTRNFTLGSSIVASYTVNSIPPVSGAPTNGNYLTFAQQIVNQPQNVVTIQGSTVTLPTSPRKYFLGVVVDPQGTIQQLSLPRNSLELIHVVGPPTRHLPAAGVVSTVNNAPFPFSPSNQAIGLVPTFTPSPTPTPTPTPASTQP